MKFCQLLLTSTILSSGLMAQSSMQENAPEIKQIDNHQMMDNLYSTSSRTWDVDLTGEFIYFYITQDLMNPIFKFDQGEVNSSTVDLTGGSYNNFNYHWEPGFKLSIGFQMKEMDSWRAALSFLRIDQDAKVSATRPAGGSIWARWFLNPGSPILDSAIAAHWTGKNQFLDFDLTKKYHMSGNLTLLPLLGMRVIWIDQEMTMNANPVPNTSRNEILKVDSQSWGIGLKSGFNVRYDLGKGFAAYATSAGSLLYSRYEVNHDERDLNNYTSILTASGAENTTRTIVETTAGANWDGSIWGLQMGVGLGYNFYVLFSQNVIRSFTDSLTISNQSDAYGNLFFQGLSVNAAVKF